MRGEYFQSGDLVRVLEKDEIITEYGYGINNFGDCGDFVSSMFRYCGQTLILTAKETYEDQDDITKYGETEWSVTFPDGSAPGYVFPDFSITKVMTDAEYDYDNDASVWQRLMQS